MHGPVTVGQDDSGQDVNFYGATSGSKFFWDESADQCEVQGTTKLYGAVTLAGAARVYREKFIGPEAWDVTNASVSESQHSSRFRALAFVPTEAGACRVDVYAWLPAPDDIDTAACMTAYAYWSSDAAVASQAAELALKWEMYGDGEATAGTSGSIDHTKFDASASDANAVEVSTMSSAVDPPAAGDLMGFMFRYQSAGSSTTGSDFQFHGLRLRYRAAALGTAT